MSYVSLSLVLNADAESPRLPFAPIFLDTFSVAKYVLNWSSSFPSKYTLKVFTSSSVPKFVSLSSGMKS